MASPRQGDWEEEAHGRGEEARRLHTRVKVRQALFASAEREKLCRGRYDTKDNGFLLINYAARTQVATRRYPNTLERTNKATIRRSSQRCTMRCGERPTEGGMHQQRTSIRTRCMHGTSHWEYGEVRVRPTPKSHVTCEPHGCECRSSAAAERYKYITSDHTLTCRATN